MIFQLLMVTLSKRWRVPSVAAGLINIIAPASAEQATIAVAANFIDAARQLESDFEAKTGHSITLAAGSTGKLYAQIVNGAPFDIFLAADQARPRLLEERQMAVPQSRFTYAIGRLVLWSADQSRICKNGDAVLAEGQFRRIAIANPELAPYGAAAKQVLQHLQYWEMLRPKIVMGENVSQSLTYVATGNAELGFVALSMVLELKHGTGSSWEPPAELYEPIRQDAVLLKRAERNEAANAFHAYLQSSDARATITLFGYRVE